MARPESSGKDAPSVTQQPAGPGWRQASDGGRYPPPPRGWWMAPDGRWCPPVATWPRRRTRIRPALWPAVVAIVLGCVFVYGGFLADRFAGLTSIVASCTYSNMDICASIPTPVSMNVPCSAGTRFIYQDVGTEWNHSTLFMGDGAPGTTLRPADITVTAPNGAPVPVRATGGMWFVSNVGGSKALSLYKPAVAFQAETTGMYRITIRSHTTVAFGAPVDQKVSYLLMLLGGVVAVGGVVWLMVAVRRRRKHRLPAYPNWPPPPSYGYGYPPQGPPGEPGRASPTAWSGSVHELRASP